MGNSRQQDIAAERKQLLAEHERAREVYRRTGNVDPLNRVNRKLAANREDDYIAAAGIDPNYCKP